MAGLRLPARVAAALLLLAALAVLPTSAAAAQDAPPPRDEVLVLGLRSWQGVGADASEPRDWLFRSGRAALSGDLDPTEWPSALVVEAEDDWLLYPARVHGAYPAKLGEVPANPYASVAPDPRTGPVPEMELGERKHFRSWLRIADALEWRDDEGAEWRRLGFTRVQVLPPKRGLLQGRAACLGLNGLPAGDALLVRDGLEVRGLRGLGGYPQTPMAALAVHRQLLADQERRRRLEAADAFREPPTPDLELTDRPLWRADSSRAVENLLDLMTGAEAGWTLVCRGDVVPHAERLRLQGVRVLYLVDFGEAPEANPRNDAERAWWQDPEELRAEKRRRWEERVRDVIALDEAGVELGLVPAASTEDWARDQQALLEAGMDPDRLYELQSRAVSRILGLREGADFLVSRGRFDFEDPDVAWVFANGRGFAYPAEPGDGGDAEDATSDDGGAAAGLAGEWRVQVQTPGGEMEIPLELFPEEGRVVVHDPEPPHEGADADEVRFRGDGVRFAFTVPDMDMDFTVQLELAGDRLKGHMETPFGRLPLTAERAAGAEPAAATDEAETASTESADGPIPPAWPVETEADRLPAAEWARDGGDSVLFRGGTLWRMDGSEPEVGDLLIEDGRISAVGGELTAPPGVPVVDAAGLHLMPGILDPHSHLALDSINEGSMAITAECRIADMIRPHAVGIYRAAAGGTVLVQSLHGSANPIGGQAAVWELRYPERRIADLLYPGAKQGIKFALGENVKQTNFPGAAGKRFPNSRLGVEAVFRRAFTEAQDYVERRRRFEAGLEPGFRRDVRLEVLADVIQNRIHVQCHSYRADELLMFLRVARDFGIRRPTFQHVLEGYKVAPELAAFGAMASTFSDWWAYKYEVVDAIPWNVMIMTRAGVVTSVNSDSDEMIRRLNTEAAKGMLYGGLTWQEAMATCTLNPAIQLRLEDRLGSLEVGKDGTVSVFDAPPLSSRARCVWSLARGRVLFQRPPGLDDEWRAYAAAVRLFADDLASTEAAADGEDATEDTPRDATATPPFPTPASDLADWTRPGRGRAYVVTDAIVHTMVDEPFRGGIAVRDGLVQAVFREGEPVPELEGAEVVDAEGRHLYPGFLDAGDVTGLFEIGAVRSARDDAEIGDWQPDLIAATAIHADSAHVRVTRMTGVAYVLVTPKRGVLRGRASLIQLEGITSEDLVVVPEVGQLLAFPRARVDEDDGPQEPDGLADLEDWVRRAEEYDERVARHEAAGIPFTDRDPRLEALRPYVRGERPWIVVADDDATLMAARDWARQHDYPVLWMGAREGWKVAGHLGADRARVVVGPVHSLPSDSFAPFDAPFRNAWVLREAGCEVALRTDDPEVTRNLPFQAGTAAAWGLGEDGALHALTLGAARVLGVDRFVGSLEPGKVATFFLADGDPMDFAPVERMWIGGGEIELTSKQTELRDRYLRRLAQD